MSAFEHDPEAKLLRMARQIADNYHADAPDKAALAIAAHINKFWSPKMREDLLAAAASQKLDPPALDAARGLINRRKAEVL